MNRDIFRDLRCAGYQPRSLLDIGAHVGLFTQDFLGVFPNCVPTLVEPNPHCQEELARLPYERHAVAASDQAGRAELFLTREWLQSTGTSLFRENTSFFRDEVLQRHEVEKVPLDTLFAGRRFDFVKIDTQGSELDILRGGRAVLRRADYILIEISMVEYNLGGARAEAVFAALADMGFHSVDVPGFHRLSGVQNGNLLQLDVLFARNAQRPTWYPFRVDQQPESAILDYLRRQRARCAGFSVLGIGIAMSSAFDAVLTARIDDTDHPGAARDFAVRLDDRNSWFAVLRHVAEHGRFSYVVCNQAVLGPTHALVVLEILPLIAEAGYIGAVAGQPRWSLTPDRDALLVQVVGAEAEAPGTQAHGVTWRGALPFRLPGHAAADPTVMNDVPALYRVDHKMADGHVLDAIETLLAVKASKPDMDALLARIRLLVNPAIRQFNAHMSAGEFNVALRYAVALTGLLPRHAEIRAAAMSCALALGRHADAARHAEILLQQDPGNKAAQQLLGTDRAGGDAERRVALALAPPDDRHPLIHLRDLHDAASVLLCRNLDVAAASRVMQLKHAARELVVDVPPDSEWAVWEKHYRLMLDAVDPAILARDLPPCDDAPDTVSILTAHGEQGDWSVLRAAVADLRAEVVFFAAADAAYVDLYGHWYVQSILRHCDVPCVVILHVIGSRGRLREVAQRLDIQDERLVLCGDDFDAALVTTRCHDAPPHGTSAKPLAHLQSVRFLRLETLLQKLRRPVFVSDVDLILQCGVSDLLARAAGEDIVVNENTLNAHAGSRITANLLLVNPTPIAALFLRFLRGFLVQALDGPDVSRWIDQIGLLMARHYVRQHAPAARLGTFDAARDINNVIYKSYVANPFRFLSLYHGFDLSSLRGMIEPDTTGAPQARPLAVA